jgi:hypothetical protein
MMKVDALNLAANPLSIQQWLSRAASLSRSSIAQVKDRASSAADHFHLLL